MLALSRRLWSIRLIFRNDFTIYRPKSKRLSQVIKTRSSKTVRCFILSEIKGITHISFNIVGHKSLLKTEHKLQIT